jgi:hypothetical protein
MPSFRTRLRVVRAAALTAALLGLAVSAGSALPATAAQVYKSSQKIPKKVRRYENSKATVRFDYGPWLNYYGHRLCLLANQPFGDQEVLTGMRYADEGYPSWVRKELRTTARRRSARTSLRFLAATTSPTSGTSPGWLDWWSRPETR